ncbi:MAG: DUF362 domain-containing protein [Candidatus Hodarchaeota archaeon]
MKNKVSVIKTNENSLDKKISEAIDLIGGFSPQNNTIIVIKPNLCSSMMSPESGVTTDVRVVDSVIQYLNSCSTGLQFRIVESNVNVNANITFKRLGYHVLEKKYENVQLYNLSEDRTQRVIIPDGKILSILELPETLLFMDYFISIAKLKRHVNERMTGIWKNQWGCLIDKRIRIPLHPYISEALFDLHSFLYPDLSIIDAIVGLEGPGPIEGNPVRMNRIICGKNPISVDIVATKMMGDKPRRVPHISYALKHRYQDAENFELVGDGFTTVKFNFISNLQYMLYRIGLRVRRRNIFFENLGYLSSTSAFALRSMGISELSRGTLIPFGKAVKLAKTMVTKKEAAEIIFG